MRPNKTALPLLFLLVLLIAIYYWLVGMAAVRIGIWGSPNHPGARLAYGWLQEHTDFQPFYLDDTHLDDLQEADLLWLHQQDSTTYRDLPAAAAGAIQAWLQQGGRLLLTQEAARQVQPLQLDSLAPQIGYMLARDGGYGRKMGLHAFLDHPVFAGLHGGAFIFGPHEDVNCRQIGYFGNHKPANGRVVAVDWAYIKLKEDRRLLIEFTPGRGRALSIGSYIWLDMPNRQQAQFELFMNNVLHYLLDEQPAAGHYWPQTDPVVQAQPLADSLPAAAAGSWQPPPATSLQPQLHLPAGSDNYLEASGRRLLVMGEEQGGIEEIWAHPFMALRDYEAALTLGDSLIWLSSLQPEVYVSPGLFVRRYRLPGATLREYVVVHPQQPQMVIHYTYQGRDSALLHLRFRSNLRRMWPYSQRTTGDIYYDWDDQRQAFVIRNAPGDMGLMLGSSRSPRWRHLGNAVREMRIPFAGIDLPPFTWGFTGAAAYSLQPKDSLTLTLAATSTGGDSLLAAYEAARQRPQQVLSANRQHSRQLLDSLTLLTTPDADFNQAYLWALLASDMFVVQTPGLGRALVAGYATSAHGWNGGQRVSGRPGYAWYFGRDGQWSSLALLDYGDFATVRDQLQFYLDFQDVSGKIFHEVSTSGVVHYDAADATPLFVLLAGRYLQHSGDVDFIRQHWPQIKKAIDFCYSTDANRDKLIDNLNVGHGWVEGGHLYGAQSTLYLSSCWAAALQAAAYMATTLGEDELATRYRHDAAEVVQIINRDFWNPSTHFYNHGKYPDGSYNEALTVMAALPVYFGQADATRAAPVLARLRSNDFTTDWGVRIVPAGSPHFNPRGYHTGSVWPLYTGWTALAEYAAGNYLAAYQHVDNNLRVSRYWGKGYIEEVLDGARYQPMGVCAHQCWSETLTLQPLLEGMLGFHPDAIAGRVRLYPAPPPQWDSLRVTNLRIGQQRLHLFMNRQSDTTRYRLSLGKEGRLQVELAPVLPPGTRVSSVTWQGQPVAAVIDTTARGWVRVKIEVALQQAGEMTIAHRGGISVLPLTPQPQPGDESQGFRLLDARLTDETYRLRFTGPAGTTHTFQVYSAQPLSEQSSGASLIKQQGVIYTWQLTFDGQEGYRDKTVELDYKP